MGDILLGISTTIIGVVGTLLAIWLRYYLEAKKAKKACKISKTVEEDCEIVSKLESMMETISADRISIFQFHNGGEYYSGKSMQKISCTYEAVKKGVSRTQMNMQNIPVSSCLETMRRLIENREFHCRDVENNYPESLCKHALIENGVKSTYQYIILNLDKKAIGMLRADFVLDQEDLSEEDDKTLNIFALKLSGYLVK